MDSQVRIEKGKWVSDRYEIVDILGHGTTGTVVKAIDHVEPASTVVLKILGGDIAQKPRSAARFEREMRLMGELVHPNIVHVFGCSDSSDPVKYIAMEHIRGQNLRERINTTGQQGLPFDEVVRIVLAMARAISYAHEKGIVHRDLKPDNVLLCRDDEVKITDFGLARFLDEEHGVTMPGEVLGTPTYMSPEHIHGDEIDQRSDIYTLGIIAYELAVGRPPFEGGSFYAVAGQHLKEPLPRINRAEVIVPEWFPKFLDKCCAKNKSERFSSAKEIIEILQTAQEANGQADEQVSSLLNRKASPVAIKSLARSRAVAAALAIALIGALVLLRLY